MLAFHVAASLIAAFTAKDDCSRVQWRIFRSAPRCDCAAWDLLKRGRKWPPLIHLFPADSIYYCLCIAHRSCSCILSSFLNYWSVISGPQVFGGFILCCIPVVKDFFLLFFLFSWFASVFLICICFVKLQRWKLSRSPLGNGPGLAGLTTIEWISI